MGSSTPQQMPLTLFGGAPIAPRPPLDKKLGPVKGAPKISVEEENPPPITD